MKLDELMNQNFDFLTLGERKIMAELLKHQKELQTLSCEQLAAQCHVSRATLLRLLKKIGIHSFAEFKLFIKSETAPDSEDNLALLEICETYHRMICEMQTRDYRSICKKIKAAGTIYIYGTGNAQKAEGEELKRMFLSSGKCVIDLFDLGETCLAKEAFCPGDLFIVISLSGETKEGIEILKAIESTEIETLSITRWDNNTMARMCRHNLYVGTKTLKGYRNVEYELTAAFYVLLDLLFVNYLEYLRENAHEN